MTPGSCRSKPVYRLPTNTAQLDTKSMIYQQQRTSAFLEKNEQQRLCTQSKNNSKDFAHNIRQHDAGHPSHDDDAGPRVWNSLPPVIRDPSLSLSVFRKLLKTYLYV